MTFSNILLGLVTGIPVMIVVGPIALLLIEQGLERGVRGAYPAALGVAGADLLFASVSAVAGVAAARVLEPFSGWLTAGAAALLLVLAARLARTALVELRPIAAAGRPESALVGGGVGGGADATCGPAPAGDRSSAEDRAAARLSADSHRRGHLALAGGFFGITALNPITIVVFATIVMGGARGVGTLGWVLGMLLASLTVNFGFVAIGHGLGAVLDDSAVARVRLAAAGLIVALALHLALG